MKKLANKSIRTIEELKNKDLLSLVGDELVVSLIDNMSKNSLNRIGQKKLVEFETEYLKIINNYITTEYKINIEQLLNEKGNELKKIEEAKQNILTQLLLSFQPIFSYCKRWLSINNVDELSSLNKILDVNLYPLKDKKISNDNLIDILTETPYYIKRDFINNKLLLDLENTSWTVKWVNKVQEKTIDIDSYSPSSKKVIKRIQLSA